MSFEIDLESMANLRPWVRFAKIQETPKLYGTWTDFDHEFTFIRRGSAEIIIEGQSYILNEGDCLLMAPFVTHVKKSIGNEELSQVVIHFDMVANPYRFGLWPIGIGQGARYEEAPPDLVPWPGSFLLKDTRPELTKNIGRISNMIIEEYQSSKPLKELQLRALMIELLVVLGRASQKVVEQEHSKTWLLVSEAASFINKNFKNKALDNSLIAKRIGTTSHYLGDIFVKHMGITLRDYLLSTRLGFAEGLLEKGYAITRVAEESGFQGIHAFSRAFKREIGMSPSQFGELKKII